MADALSLVSSDSRKRRSALAQALIQSSLSDKPIQSHAQGLARLAQALWGGAELGMEDKRERERNAALAATLEGALADGSATTLVPASAPSFAGGAGARTMAMPNLAPEMKTGIADAAGSLGISPVDLATVISYETGGTFDPTQAGPTTKWGQHRGLIQFGEPQAKQYGVDWSNPAGSQLGANGAIVAYLRDRGVKPGMGLMDIYSTVNAGAPGLYDRSDAAAGGAPGTVADKVNNQMAGHRAKAMALFADAPAPGAAPVALETGQPGFAVPPAPASAMTGANFDAITNGQPLAPAFQSEGLSQPWMGSTYNDPAALAPQVAQAPLPPPRPTDLATPQADMPAAEAVPAMGQFAPVTPPVVDPNSPDGGMRALQAAEAQGGSSPFSGLARALAGNGAPPAAPPAAAAPSAAQAAPPQTGGTTAAPPQNRMAALAVALARSGDRDGAVKLATALLQPQAPIVMGDRLVSRDGRVIADFTQANGGRSKSYGLNPIWGTDKNGKPVIGQIGEKGDFVQTKMPEDFNLSSGVDKIDAGTHWVLQDKRTGQTVGTIPKDIAGEERQKVEGKAAGESSVGLGDAVAKAESVLESIKGIRNHPGRDAWGAQGGTAAWPFIGNGLPGTQGRDFVTRVEQLKGQSFLEAFNMLRGGGAISEAEGKAATGAIARLDRAQSKEGFDAALDDLEKIVRGGIDRARKKAGVSSGSPSASASSGGWNEVAPGVRIREKR